MRFLDTSFFYAGIVRKDERHPQAAELLRRSRGKPMTTTNHVRGETWTLIRSREGHGKACEFLTSLERSPVEIAWIDRELEREALAWLRKHDEREYSFVDATSFAFMRRSVITEALAFGGDFAAAGFVELRP